MELAGPAEILVVDDEQDICDYLSDYLKGQGFAVRTANDGAQMRDRLAESPADLVILDVMMPGEDGLSLTRYLRQNSDVAIIILTGREDEVDRIVGLELGADDYLHKPVSARELVARVKTILRRTQKAGGGLADDEAAIREFAGWRFDRIARRLVNPKGRDVALTTMEFNLLTALTDHPNEVLNRDVLLETLQHRSWEPYDRSIDVLVGRLRGKIEADPKKPKLIKTVRGEGYVLAAAVRAVDEPLN